MEQLLDLEGDDPGRRAEPRQRPAGTRTTTRTTTSTSTRGTTPAEDTHDTGRTGCRPGLRMRHDIPLGGRSPGRYDYTLNRRWPDQAVVSATAARLPSSCTWACPGSRTLAPSCCGSTGQVPAASWAAHVGDAAVAARRSRACGFMAFGQFRGLWRYASLYDLRNIVAGRLSSSAAVLRPVRWVFAQPNYPRSSAT